MRLTSGANDEANVLKGPEPLTNEPEKSLCLWFPMPDETSRTTPKQPAVYTIDPSCAYCQKDTVMMDITNGKGLRNKIPAFRYPGPTTYLDSLSCSGAIETVHPFH